MTTDTKPLPERFDCTNGNTPWCQGCYTMTPDEYGDYVQWEDYERMTAAQDAEIERLRAEREVIGAEAVKYADKSGRLEAKAERLAEALRIAFRHLDVGSMQVSHKKDIAAIVAALRDHEQEDGNP